MWTFLAHLLTLSKWGRVWSAGCPCLYRKFLYVASWEILSSEGKFLLALITGISHWPSGSIKSQPPHFIPLPSVLVKAGPWWIIMLQRKSCWFNSYLFPEIITGRRSRSCQKLKTKWFFFLSSCSCDFLLHVNCCCCLFHSSYVFKDSVNKSLNSVTYAWRGHRDWLGLQEPTGGEAQTDRRYFDIITTWHPIPYKRSRIFSVGWWMISSGQMWHQYCLLKGQPGDPGDSGAPGPQGPIGMPVMLYKCRLWCVVSVVFVYWASCWLLGSGRQRRLRTTRTQRYQGRKTAWVLSSFHMRMQR